VLASILVALLKCHECNHFRSTQIPGTVKCDMTTMKKGRKNSRESDKGSRNLKNKPPSTGQCPVSPDLFAIMGRFDQALSLVVVCHRSLAAQESADVGDEEEVLRRAIRLLRDVYNEIDLASGTMRKSG
jgi:hypothetical protein